MNNGFRSCLLVFIALLGLVFPRFVNSAPPEARTVLVYTKNQVAKGLFVHDNIAASSAALQKLGKDNGFSVEVSEDPAIFTPAKLKKYRAIVFNNTNNEIFETEEQKAAFQAFIRSGGGGSDSILPQVPCANGHTFGRSWVANSRGTPSFKSSP